MNLTIKSGTNQIHGSAYYYNRNEAYAAASPFLPRGHQAPELRNYNTGFTAGGPIIKDKTFLFIGFERQDYIFGLSGPSTEPSTACVNQPRPCNDDGGFPGESDFAILLPRCGQVRSPVFRRAENYFATSASTGYSYNGVIRLDENFNPNNHFRRTGSRVREARPRRREQALPCDGEFQPRLLL